MTPDFIRAMRLDPGSCPSFRAGAVRVSEIVTVERWLRSRAFNDPTFLAMPMELTMRDGSSWLWRPLLSSWAEAEAVLALSAGRCPVHHDPDHDLVASQTCPLCRPELMPWWAEERNGSPGAEQP